MSNIETAIHSKLSSIPGLDSLVGTRIYSILPGIDEILPFVIFAKVSKLPTNAMQSTGNLRHMRIQIDLYGKDYDECLAVRDVLLPSMERWSDSGAEVHVVDCFLENEIDLYDDATKQAHIAIDFILHYYGI